MSSKKLVKDIIIVAVVIVTIWIGLQVIFGAQNPFYVVSSTSMVPNLEVYDILVISGNISFEEIGIADVIVFDRPKDHDRVIVHRVVAIIEDEPKTIRTQGDNNPSSIPGTDFPITEEEYLGKVIYVIPKVGYITKILAPPINYIIIAVIIGIMVVKEVTKNKKKNEEKEDENKTIKEKEESSSVEENVSDDLKELKKKYSADLERKSDDTQDVSDGKEK